MYNEIRLLVTDEKMYLLGEKSTDAFGLLCRPHKIGDMAIAFANTDFTYLKDLSRFRQAVDRCLFGDALDCGRLQTLVMQLIQLLDDNVDTFWFFEIERIGLQRLDRDLVRTVLRTEELSAKINDILSHLESLIEFQNDLRAMLSELSLADKKASGHASSAQILCRLFREFPEICNFCFGKASYVLVDVDEHGEVRTEMLDRNMSNAFRSVLEPESPLLEYNDINDDKMICEYHVLSDVKMCVMFDLIEGLRRANFFAQCATCKTFFFTTDKRRAYCFNKKCSEEKSRMRKHKDKIKDDPFLEEAYRYKNTMTSRYRRTNDEENKKVTSKNLSHKEYENWSNLFHEACNEYEQEKAKAVLRCASKEEIDCIGKKFLDDIRPEGYKPQRKRKK